MRPVVILGSGYTGARVARLLLAAGARVLATSRDPGALAPLAAAGAEVVRVDAADRATLAALRTAAAPLGELAVLCSVPPVTREGRLEDPTAALLAQLGRPTRVVYLSTTAVYGDQVAVDARTAAAPRSAANRLRLAAEKVTSSGAWSGMVLRAAAIYGPWRGVHASAGAALRRPLAPDRIVSRIHVDDLAAVCVAALRAGATGAWPVADELPATPREVAAFCGSIGLDVPALPARRADGDVRDPPSGRRVDGRAVIALLGVPLAYPSYRQGIPACLREQDAESGREMGSPGAAPSRR